MRFNLYFPRAGFLCALIASAALPACSSNGNTATNDELRTGGQCAVKGTGHTPNVAGNPLDEITPAPASIGADVPGTYFGPAPSSVNKKLVGPVTLLTAGKIDFEAGTVTLPLYRGKVKSTGKPIWYVLTDTNDKGNAEGLGLNYSAKLGNVAGSFTDAAGISHSVARSATEEPDGTLVFDNGTVDFSPARVITAGDAPNYFPPKGPLQPGAVGDADYTPIVRLTNAGGFVYNAPVVAYGIDADQLSFCDGKPDYTKVHDKVVKLCPTAAGGGTVTFQLTTGFSFGKPVLYLSLESNVVLAATVEAVTLAPALDYRAFVGRDDSAFSAVERLFTFVNGPVNPAGGINPQRQGLGSLLKGDSRSPLNVIGGIPTVATDYSPLWDLNVGEWTADAIRKGYRSRLNEEFQVLGFVARGFVTAPGGGKFGSSGIIVNCPIVHRFL